MHVLFGCEFARAVWAAAGLETYISLEPNDKFLDVIKRIFRICTKEQSALVGSFCWSLWDRRNKWVWDKINISVFGVKSTVFNLLTDWRKAQEKDDKIRSNSECSSRHWLKPPQGWLKINLDAAVFQDINCIGIGCLIRDAFGSFLHVRCQNIVGAFQPPETKTYSLEVLSWVKSLSLKNKFLRRMQSCWLMLARGTRDFLFWHNRFRLCRFIQALWRSAGSLCL